MFGKLLLEKQIWKLNRYSQKACWTGEFDQTVD